MDGRTVVHSVTYTLTRLAFQMGVGRTNPLRAVLVMS